MERRVVGARGRMGALELELRVLDHRRGRHRSDPLELEPVVVVDVVDQMIRSRPGEETDG